MTRHPIRERTDVQLAVGPPVLGVLVWILTGEWRWSITGLLLTVATLAVAVLRRRDEGWTVVASALAVPAGLVAGLWTGDSRWIVLGLFPVVFVLINRLATAVERRR